MGGEEDLSEVLDKVYLGHLYYFKTRTNATIFRANSFIMKRSRKSIFSKAHRVRTGWFVILADVPGSGVEMHLGWKFYKGEVGMFSAAGSRGPKRPPWGSLIDCSLVTEQNGRHETDNFFKFQNRSMEKRQFKLAEMNSFFWEVNEFTSSICEMRQTGREKLLALYLGLMPKSSKFSGHKVGVFDDQGFRLDKSGVTEETLKENGGSAEELSKFLDKAGRSALKVAHRGEIIDKLPDEVKKRKATETVVKHKKSKVEKINDSKSEEMKDKNGLEKDFRKRFIGRADIPLRNITVHPDVSLIINPYKTRGIAKSMLSCYDPTQMVLMVTPVSGLPFNPIELERNIYHVFHGRHRLLALKQIEESGRLAELEGFENNSITCHVVNVNSGGAVQVNYGACRGNEIQAKFTRNPHLHEMTYILHKIRQSCEKEKCLETMSRYGKLLGFGADDQTALRKFSSWSLESLGELCEVFKLYETTNTLDAKTFVKRKISDIQEGKTIEFPRNLFRKFACLEEDYFMLQVPGIKRKEVSVKESIEKFAKLLKRRSIASKVQDEFGLRSIEEVKTTFPGRFDDSVLDAYAAAVSGRKETNSSVAADLREYCHSLIEEKPAVPRVTLTVIDSLADLDLSSLNINHLQTVVFNVKGCDNDLVQKLEIVRQTNNQISFILIFEKQAEQLKVAELLEFDANKSEYNPKNVYFLKDNSNKKVGQYFENLVHGIVCTRTLYEAPLRQFNGPLKNLELIVNQISPPGATLAFVNESNLKITKIHSKFPCEYIGLKMAIERFSTELNHDLDGGGDEEELQFTEKASTSNPNIPEKDASLFLESFSVFSPPANSTFVQNNGQNKECGQGAVERRKSCQSESSEEEEDDNGEEGEEEGEEEEDSEEEEDGDVEGEDKEMGEVEGEDKEEEGGDGNGKLEVDAVKEPETISEEAL